MTDYLWPAVALVALVLAFAAVMRWLGNAPRADLEATKDFAVELRREFDEHKKTWDLVGVQWRQKVIELEQKCDRVVIDAKNEIAGTVASVTEIGKKGGWR